MGDADAPKPQLPHLNFTGTRTIYMNNLNLSNVLLNLALRASTKNVQTV